MTKEIKINNIIISRMSPPFTVVDAGVNYYEIAKKEKISLLDAAKLMIKEAARAGADAIKFQIYKAEKLASQSAPAYWNTKQEKIKSQYGLFKKYDKFTEKKYKALSKYAKGNNIIFMSTPFDKEAVDFLDKLSPVFKIASADITNFPLIKYISRKGKPIFLSTGASTIKEIKEAVSVINKEGNDKIVIMHCILNYPTKYADANLRMITHLKTIFPEHLIGYSDHTLPDPNMLLLTAAVLLGAKVIEKHFTLDKSLPGNDHYHAMDPSDLKILKNNLRFLEKILGKEKKEPLKSEFPSKKYARRSIVARKDIPRGTKISKKMITYKRPGTGIKPKFFKKVIGKTAKRKIKEDAVITWEDLC